MRNPELRVATCHDGSGLVAQFRLAKENKVTKKL